MNTAGACSYELDARLHLVAADEAFANFALANDAPELVPPGPLGRSLMSFISDPTTAHLYAELFRRVATRQSPLTVRLRCDSPTLRRFLTLTISPRASGFRLVSHVERVEERDPQPLLGREQATGTGALMRMCSWCKRMDVHGAWLEVEEAVATLRLFEHAPPPRLTHTMCRTCHQEFGALVAGD